MVRKRTPLVVNGETVELDAPGFELRERRNGARDQYWVATAAGERKATCRGRCGYIMTLKRRTAGVSLSRGDGANAGSPQASLLVELGECDLTGRSAGGCAAAPPSCQVPSGNRGFESSTRRSRTASSCTARDW
jgi:hypothetical protein